MKEFFIVLAVVFLTAGFINAQGKMALGVNAGVALPMGDFGDGYDMGFGGNGLFVYHASPNVDVTGSVGYLTWSGKDSSDFTFSSIPVMVGGKYLFGKGKFNPYINAELGVHFVTFDTPEYTVFGQTVGGSVSDTYFGWGIGAGFLYEIGKNMDLDFNARYNSIASEGSSSEYLSFLIGILFGLN
ncbi:MAG TPA: outer membrane beta-barrel protein [Ignavibacteriaceae bacterium]|jgi:opacity protein-like surface antigen